MNIIRKFKLRRPDTHSLSFRRGIQGEVLSPPEVAPLNSREKERERERERERESITARNKFHNNFINLGCRSTLQLMENLHKGATANSFQFARLNRQEQTKAEQLLWMKIRNKRLKGFKFRRQHPIGNFILDFYCHRCLLAVEIDGEYHNQTDQKDYDLGRSYDLKELGIKVIRFKNSEVEEDINWVIEEIKKHLY